MSGLSTSTQQSDYTVFWISGAGIMLMMLGIVLMASGNWFLFPAGWMLLMLGIALLTLGLVGRHWQVFGLRPPTRLVVKVRCNQCNTLNYESSGHCKKCGAKL